MFSFLLFSLPACYEPKDGCLDITATNFDFDADKGCGDCCEYPILKLDLQHKILVDTQLYNLNLEDSVYYDHFDQPFKIKSIQFYLSGFHLIAEDGAEVGVTDSIELELTNPQGSTATVEDNFVLVDPAAFQTYTLGEFPGEYLFRTVQFTLGLEEPSAYADPASLDEDHPMATQSPSMYENGNYVFSKVELLRDTTPADTIPAVLRVLPDDGLKVVYLNIPFGYFKVDGLDTTVVLRIDYSKWFEGMDVKNDTEEVLSAKLAQNMPAAFSFVEIK